MRLDGADAGDLTGRDGTHLIIKERHDGQRLSVERGELNFVARASLADENDRADVTLLQPVIG